MPTFRIERRGALDLEFDGEILADMSSREGDAPRWTEIRIYRTSTGRFVSEVIGRTVVRGERDRVDVRVHEKPADLPEALKRDRGYLTKLALEALDEAAEHDPSIRPAVTERI